MAPDVWTPSPKVLIALGSLAMHAAELLTEEAAGPSRHAAAEFDRGTIRSLLTDPDLRAWLDDAGRMALLPVRRERPDGA